MKIASIVLNEFKSDLTGDVFGVDYGAWLCYEKNIPMKAACGDFDSVDQNQKNAVFSLDIPIHVLPEEKDMTDFEYCLSLLDDYDLIYVYGALGGRKDHEYLNVRFAMRDHRLVLMDDLNRIQSLKQGVHIIKKDTFKYLSFLSLEKSLISLTGVKYPLDKRRVDYYDAYLGSNEIIDQEAKVTVISGSLLMIQSKDA